MVCLEKLSNHRVVIDYWTRGNYVNIIYSSKSLPRIIYTIILHFNCISCPLMIVVVCGHQPARSPGAVWGDEDELPLLQNHKGWWRSYSSTGPGHIQRFVPRCALLYGLVIVIAIRLNLGYIGFG